MKNIYQDDFVGEESQDIFSHGSYEKQLEEIRRNPEKPFIITGGENFSDDASMKSPSAEKTVRTAKQAPPPIKKAVTAQTAQTAQAPQPTAAYPQQPYPQQICYQPVYYQVDPNQPYPQQVYPTTAYPTYYNPAQPYPGQPVFYPQPGVADPAAYMQPQTAYPQMAQPYQQPQPEAADNEAGTRVLFQSPDFDKKEELSDSYATLPHDYGRPTPTDFDVTEVELPSKKRAGKPSQNPVAFKVDEMEIGTYELNIMTANRTSKATGVSVPLAETESKSDYHIGFSEESYEDFSNPVPLNQPQVVENAQPQPTEPAPSAKKKKKAKESKRTVSTSEIIRRSILGISSLAIVIAGGTLFNEYRLSKENEKLMSNISNLIITEVPVTQPSTTLPSTTNKNDKNKETTQSTTLITTTRPLTDAEQWALIKKENPDITFPENMQLKYAKLYAQNTDFVGYLYADGSDVDFPIVQAEDDEEYVEKNFYGESTKYACPFVTHRNNIQTLDTNTVIFGHHMRDGSIFAALDQYRTLEGYKEAPIITFNTLYADYNFKVIATMITNINPEEDNGYVFNYYWTNLNNHLNYSAYLNQLSQRSLYDTGVDVQTTDKLLTLSTCSNDFDDARLVVVARLVRPGEASAVDTSKAVENPNPRFPQAYYDEEGEKNPFADAYRWQIS